MLAAVILSAGASSRMGRPKALLPYREGTFLEHLIEVTRHPKIGVTRVVLGAGADVIRTIAKLDPAVVAWNPEWEQGQLSSMCAGLRSLDGIETDGIVLCPVDHPLVSARLVSELVERFYGGKKAIVLPTYKGRRGHPVIFSKALFGELLAAPADKGARAIVWAHAGDVLEVPTDEEGVILNLNDPDMLARALGPDTK
ncbi:MAG TPA: nucleotidyltransferase family protein [Candidatus Acidoferrales bacterium]|nr:nucleotidyltransferase family protein [Candidatus Acidoferrales bacterium]